MKIMIELSSMDELQTVLNTSSGSRPDSNSTVPALQGGAAQNAGACVNISSPMADNAFANNDLTALASQPSGGIMYNAGGNLTKQPIGGDAPVNAPLPESAGYQTSRGSFDSNAAKSAGPCPQPVFSTN